MQKTLETLTQEYFDEFQVIDKLNQHPEGYNFDEWLQVYHSDFQSESKQEITITIWDTKKVKVNLGCKCIDWYWLGVVGYPVTISQLDSVFNAVYKNTKLNREYEGFDVEIIVGRDVFDDYGFDYYCNPNHWLDICKEEALATYQAKVTLGYPISKSQGN